MIINRGAREARRLNVAIQREGWVLGLEPSDPWFWDMDEASLDHLARWIWEDLSPAERRVAKALPLDRLASFALAGRDFGMAPELSLHRKAARAMAFCSYAGPVGPSPIAPRMAIALALAWSAQGVLTSLKPAWGWAGAIALLASLCFIAFGLARRADEQSEPGWAQARKIWPELFENGGDETRARSLASYWALPPELKALAPAPKTPWVKARACQEELEACLAPAASNPSPSRRL